MRTHSPGTDKTFEAAIDLSAKQFCFVKGAAAVSGGQSAQVTTATANARALGILQNKPDTANQGAVVRFSGVSKLKVDGSGEAILVGSPLQVQTGGHGILADDDQDFVAAIALEASTANGDIIAVMLAHYYLGA